MRTIAPALALLVGALSAIVPGATVALERLSDEVRAVRPFDRPLVLSGRGNEAVQALIEGAEQELSAGRPAQASLALERALRIEPSNPTVWHYLGLARLDAGDYAQAEAMASRSQSLAPADRALRARNARLVAAARRASGQPATPLPNGLEALPSREAEDAPRYATLRPPPNDDIEALPSRNSFDVESAPSNRYYTDADDRRERLDRKEQRNRRAPADVRVRTEVGVPAPAWRARAEGGTDRARREYPPSRECRFWFPDRPPSRQPPPFKCDDAPGRVPPGAVLLMSI